MTPTQGRVTASPWDEAERRAMRLAVQLARRGAGATRPNPMVGAVLVRGGRIIGRGWHHRAGGPHAEIEALRDASGRARGATLYVTLEPCCHQGRTGPCTTAILEAGISRVVVGCRDPNPLVHGGGIRLLRRRGVQVALGCLEDECRELIRPFAVWVTEHRPLVTLKTAATLDGFIAEAAVHRDAPGSIWITGEEAHRRVHLMRAEHDAVLVGAGTVHADDPLLTVRMARLPAGRSQPLRVILDGRLAVSPAARVLRRSPGVPATLVLGAEGASPARVRALGAAGAEVVLLPARAGVIAPATVLAALAGRDIQTLLVEGGAAVNAAFIAAGLVDRVALFLAPRLLGAGVPIAAGPRASSGGLSLAAGLTLSTPQVSMLGRDLLLQAEVMNRSSRRDANRSK